MRNRIDGNHSEIIKALQKCGATVQDLSQVGGGCPDILVGIFGKNYLIEIKNPETKYDLSTEQILWHDQWKGHKIVVRTVDEALRVIGVQV